MKLYTEEQVMKAIVKARFLKNWWDLEFEFDGDEIIDQLTTIELPSDKEIERAAINQNENISRFYTYGFLDCAKWMKEQILNQNK